MAGRVTHPNQIYINGQYYRADSINMFPASVQPPKFVTGEVQDESNPRASTLTLDDLRGGIGVLVGDLREDVNRCWWSTCSLRYKGHIVPQRLVTATAATATTDDIGVLADFKNQIYATVDTAVYIYDNSGDAWGSSVNTLLAEATDWARGILYPSGTATDTLVIATTTEVDYTTDGSSWSRNTTDIKFLTFWDDLLWGIDNAGQLYYTDDLSVAWTADAQLPLPAGYIQGLLVARGPDREQKLYAATNVGLYVLNADESKFKKTDLDLPYHPDAGKGSVVFRGNILFSAGNGVYLFQAGADQTVVTVVGPDRRDGLPASRRGTIVELLASHNDLLALLSAVGNGGTSNLTTRSSGGFGSHRRGTFAAEAGFSEVLGWDEQGWEVKWLGSATARGITAGVVSNAYNTYRLWFAYNQRIYYQQLPVDVINPTQISSTDFESSATLETSWFDGGVSNQNKLGLSVFVDSTHPTTSETLKIEYATNLTESYTTLATKSATGQTEYMLPSSSDVTGVAFRYWKFRLTWAQGSIASNYADLHKIFLVYRKKATTLWGVTAQIDLTDKSNPNANSTPSLQQLKNLNTAMNTNTLIEVTWRDDTSGEQNYYMDMVDLQTSETSGRVPPGKVLVTLMEPRQSTSR